MGVDEMVPVSGSSFAFEEEAQKAVALLDVLPMAVIPAGDDTLNAKEPPCGGSNSMLNQAVSVLLWPLTRRNPETAMPSATPVTSREMSVFDARVSPWTVPSTTQ
jgi:hypothetical protein